LQVSAIGCGAVNQYQNVSSEHFELALVLGCKPGLMVNSGGGNQTIEARSAPS
jgi:hypothetical protein